jgi:hypothetical protein
LLAAAAVIGRVLDAHEAIRGSEVTLAELDVTVIGQDLDQRWRVLRRETASAVDRVVAPRVLDADLRLRRVEDLPEPRVYRCYDDAEFHASILTLLRAARGHARER